MNRKRNDRWSRTSPRNSKRACLCKDGNSYSRKCCNGNMINQGIGSLTGQGGSVDIFDITFDETFN